MLHGNILKDFNYIYTAATSTTVAAIGRHSWQKKSFNYGSPALRTSFEAQRRKRKREKRRKGEWEKKNKGLLLKKKWKGES